MRETVAFRSSQGGMSHQRGFMSVTGANDVLYTLAQGVIYDSGYNVAARSRDLSTQN